MHLIFFTLVFFTGIGCSYRKRVNPIFVFNIVWLTCFFLYYIKLSKTYTNEISLKAVIVFEIMILAFNTFCLLGKYSCSSKTKHILVVNLIHENLREKYLKKLFFIWLSLTFFEIIHFKGVPLGYILLGKTGVNYASFGLPSLHGFINSLSWFILNISFIHYLDTGNKIVLRYMIIIAFMYVCLLARQSMMTGIVQLTTIFLYKKRVKPKKIVLIITTTVLLFGLIGNIRSSAFLFRTDFRYQLPPYLYGIVWAYMYMVSPIGNMVNYINHWSNFQYGVSSLNTLLPTVVTNLLRIAPRGKMENFLVLDTYNISSGLFQPYIDFGRMGILICFAFMGFVGGRIWKKVKSNPNEHSICDFAVYISIVALLFFFNGFLSMPVVVQFFYSNILFRNYFSTEISSSWNLGASQSSCQHLIAKAQ